MKAGKHRLFMVFDSDGFGIHHEIDAACQKAECRQTDDQRGRVRRMKQRGEARSRQKQKHQQTIFQADMRADAAGSRQANDASDAVAEKCRTDGFRRR